MTQKKIPVHLIYNTYNATCKDKMKHTSSSFNKATFSNTFLFSAQNS